MGRSLAQGEQDAAADRVGEGAAAPRRHLDVGGDCHHLRDGPLRDPDSRRARRRPIRQLATSPAGPPELTEGILYVRCTLSAIDNNHLVITAPKTRSSRAWVAISPRVATALRHQATTTTRMRGDPDDPFTGLVFCRPDGRPLGPHHVLDRLHQLSEEAGVPRVTVHDLRHLAATITISAGVPLTVVSKTLRHSTLSTSANIYSHLTRQAAREAVDTIDRALTGAEKAGLGTSRPASLRPPRDHIQRLVRRLRSPVPLAFSATASRPQAGRATTLRPPWPRTHERPSSQV
ncbi:tyrosine-type recombinase/integrase [Streptomyces sp. NBC_01276]|uniref:tyrosine-type recombinase/integrase n=1 Tax=Streptomyces sp. NBC_01276 TaxID=2903808 RepID=UPI00352D0FCF